MLLSGIGVLVLVYFLAKVVLTNILYRFNIAKCLAAHTESSRNITTYLPMYICTYNIGTTRSQFLTRLVLSFNFVSSRHQFALLLFWGFSLLLAAHFLVFRHQSQSHGGHSLISGEGEEEDAGWGLGALMRAASAEEEAAEAAVRAEKHIEKIKVETSALKRMHQHSKPQ